MEGAEKEPFSQGNEVEESKVTREGFTANRWQSQELIKCKEPVKKIISLEGVGSQ